MAVREPCDSITSVDLDKHLDEVRKQSKGFLEAYKDFLEKWGAYQKSAPMRPKQRQWAKYAMFKAIFPGSG